MNIPNRDRDRSRLAKWAQEFIEQLERTIREKDKHIAELSNKHPGSNVVLSGGHTEPDVGLPPNSRVYFYAGDGREPLTNMIEVHHDLDDSGLIYLASYGGSGLHIHPRSSNSVYLSLERRRLWVCGSDSLATAPHTSRSGLLFLSAFTC